MFSWKKILHDNDKPSLSNIDLYIFLCTVHRFMCISYSFDLPLHIYYITSIINPYLTEE